MLLLLVRWRAQGIELLLRVANVIGVRRVVRVTLRSAVRLLLLLLRVLPGRTGRWTVTANLVG